MRDRFDNDVKEGGATVNGKLVNNETGEEVPVSIVDNGDGTYHATYPGVQKAGTYTLTPTVEGENVKDAPFTVVVKHAAPDGSKFTWEDLSSNWNGEGSVNTVAAGQTESFKIVSRDAFGNQISAGGLDVSGKSDLGEVKVTDNGDGSYGVSYTPTKAGSFPTSISYSGAAIGGHTNPYEVKVVPAAADPGHFKWEGSISLCTSLFLKHLSDLMLTLDLKLNEDGQNVVVAGEEESFKVIAYDQFDNRIEEGGLNVKGSSDFDVNTTDSNGPSIHLFLSSSERILTARRFLFLQIRPHQGRGLPAPGHS